MPAPRIDKPSPPHLPIYTHKRKMSYTDTAAAPLWQTTLQNSRTQSRAWNSSAASTLVVPTSSVPQKAAASPRASSAGASRHEPGHDLAAHGDLERHCGTPWFS